jgi:hypothetical protein
MRLLFWLLFFCCLFFYHAIDIETDWSESGKHKLEWIMDLMFGVCPKLSSDVADLLSAILAPANERASCESLLKLIDRAWLQGMFFSLLFFLPPFQKESFRVYSQSCLLSIVFTLGTESKVQLKPSSVNVPFVGSNRVRSQGRSGDKSFPLTNATSAALASGVDIDVKAIVMPSPHSATELPDAATMSTEKQQNATTANNANPNSMLLATPPAQAYRSPLVAGRGRGFIVPIPNHPRLIVPNQGSTTPNTQNRTNG